MAGTKRLYLLDDHCLESNAIVCAVRDNALAVDQTCLYPGGVGQPADHGTIAIDGRSIAVSGVEVDADGTLWHACPEAQADWIGRTVLMRVDGARRYALSRYHTVLHVLNTIAQRDHGAWITGAQIG